MHIRSFVRGPFPHKVLMDSFRQPGSMGCMSVNK
jgi:hypothetical protein